MAPSIGASAHDGWTIPLTVSPLMLHRFSFNRDTLLLAATIAVVGVLFGALDRPGGEGGALRGTVVSAGAPFLRAGAALHRGLGSLWSGVFGHEDLSRENAALREELADLRVRKARERAFDALASVTQQVSTNIPEGTWDLIAAPVLAGPTHPDRKTLWVARGRADGLAVGMPVLSAAGVVGIVAEVHDTTAMVELVTDRRSVFGAEVEHRAEAGVLRGTGDERRVELHFERTAVRAEEGDLVVTSGMAGSVAPGGVPFGRIDFLKTSKTGEPIAIVELSEVPSRLRTVFILPLTRLPWEPAS